VILSDSSITSSYNVRASQSVKNMGMAVGWRKISRLCWSLNGIEKGWALAGWRRVEQSGKDWTGWRNVEQAREMGWKNLNSQEKGQTGAEVWTGWRYDDQSGEAWTGRRMVEKAGEERPEKVEQPGEAWEDWKKFEITEEAWRSLKRLGKGWCA
jgi:hypothetical protein